MTRSISILVILCTAAASSSTWATPITVLPVVGGGDGAAAITDDLRQSARAFGVEVQSGEQTRSLVANAASLGIKCVATSASCAIQLGGLAGSGSVVAGELDGANLTVHRYDVAGSHEVGRVTLAWTPTTSATMAKLAMVRLFQPELEVGRLFVAVDVVGASVIVDGANRGTSPIAPIALSPGAHEVYVADVDHDSQTFRVDVAFDANVTLDVQLAPPAERIGSHRGNQRPSMVQRHDGEFRRVAVLQVVARGFEPLTAVLSTEVLVAELQKVDGLIVITPQDLTGLLGPDGATRLAQCIDDICYAKALQASRSIDEAVIVDVTAEDDFPLVTARRIDVGTTETIERDNTTIRTGRSGRSVGRHIEKVVRTLYPGESLITDAAWGISSELDRRYAPPPVSVLLFAGTIAATAISAGTTVAAAIAYQGASDDARTIPGALLAAGAVVTAVTLGAAIIESPFVDWAGDAAANSDLLKSYGYSSR